MEILKIRNFIFDACISSNTFEHLPLEELKKTLTILKSIVKKNGIIVLEVPDLDALFESVGFDTIYHEHLRYYSLESLKYLFNKYGMKIIHAKKGMLSKYKNVDLSRNVKIGKL